MPKRVAFLQFGGKGDVLMAHCVFDEVMARHPMDQVDWHVFEYNMHAVRYPGLHNRAYRIVVWPIATLQEAVEKQHDVWRQMKAAASQYDVVYSPQHYPDYPNLPLDGNPRHLLDQMYEHAGLPSMTPRRINYMPLPREKAEAQSIIKSLPDKYIAVNARGLTSGNAWADDQYTDLAKRLDVPLVVGDANISHCLSVSCSLPAWRDVIAKAALYIGLDSGGTWLAASTVTPQIVLRKSVTPKWLTGFEEARVKDAGLFEELEDDLSVDRVEEAVGGYLDICYA